jgi:uncharacterized protein DUF3618
MGEVKRTTDEIEREIEQVRARLVNDVSTLEVVVQAKLDWRRSIRHRPLAFLGGAFVIGFILGVV